MGALAKAPFHLDKNMRILIVDTSSILHQVSKHLVNLKTSTGLPSGAVYNFVHKVQALKQFNADRIYFALDAGHDERDKENDGYKANRQHGHNDYAALILPFLKAIDCDVVKQKGMEADDIIYTLCKLGNSNKKISQIIVLSKDYDMSYTLVFKKVRHFMKFDNEVTDHSLFMRFGCKPKTLPLWKALFGDTSDNIKPVKGIPKKIKDIVLQKFMVSNDYRDIIEGVPKECIPTILSNIRLVRMKFTISYDYNCYSYDAKKLERYLTTYEITKFAPDTFKKLRL